MRARIAATRWAPEMEDMGWRYGFDGGYLRELARTWQSEFDWREAERAINQFTHYRVTIDGFPIHFIREPGKGPKPIPLILTHGWPWTFWDMQKVRSEEHTSELQSLMRNSYAGFCLKKKKQ